MRKLLIATALLCFLIASVYAALPAIAEYSVRQLLAEQQIDASFDLQRPGLNTIRINQLKLQKSTPDQSFVLTAEAIDLRFTPWLLFNSQRVKSLHIDGLQLDLALAQRSAATTEPGQLPFPPLPSYLLKQLPADTIKLEHFRVNIHSSSETDSFPPLVFSGHLSTDNEQLRLSVDQIQDAPQIALKLMVDHQDTGQLTLSTQEIPALEARFSLSYQAPQLSVQSQTNLYPEQLQILLQQPLLTAFMALPAPVSLPEISGTVTLSGSSEIPLDSGLSATSHHYQVSSQVALQRPIPELARLDMQQNSALLLENDELTLTIEQLSANGQQFAAHGSGSGAPTIRSDAIQVELINPLQIKTTVQTLSQSGINTLQLPRTDLLIRLQPVTIKSAGQPDIQISSAPLSLSLSEIRLSDQHLQADLTADQIEGVYNAHPLPLIKLNSHADISPEKVSQRFSLNLQDKLLAAATEVSGSTTTDLTSNRTTGSWKTAVPLTGIEKLLRRFSQEIPPELVFTAGTLHQQGWLDMNNTGIALRLLNRTNKASFSYDQTHLYDIDWSSETVKNHRGKLEDSGQLEIAFIDVGVPLQNFSGRYRLEQSAAGKQTLQLDSSTVDLLGGKVTTLPVTLALDNPDFKTAIAVTGIDLAQLIALEQQEGLTGSGTLNGQMPVHFSDGALTITGGQVLSTPDGGWIRFEPPAEFLALQEANPALGIAFDALRNMRYESLGIELDYQPDGEALLKTHLKGHNPNWNRGQPVDFTINIEENIPKLLQALQFTDKLTKTLEKRYR
ncbi:Dicarboxylate transport [Amphritea atlantica]|uniref:Dicarboxylate transport n=1 Tax=Amphritea atlantica TaxID=355243 RepID=A0A1H9IYM0_9GAMM|nr:YdbH domain-containing protein [Amphritea atlantica]SEQ79901.1 Dicarboxylate transport [Amphritea atlantica]